MAGPVVRTHPLVALLAPHDQDASAEARLARDVARAPIDARLRDGLGVSAETMVQLLELWDATAQCGRREGGVVHGVLFARLAEWVGLEDGHADRSPVRDWAAQFAWPAGLAAPWEASYHQGWARGQGWRRLQASPIAGNVGTYAQLLLTARNTAQGEVLRATQGAALRAMLAPTEQEDLQAWEQRLAHTAWEQRMARLAHRTRVQSGSLEGWWRRTRRGTPDRLGAIRAWWAIVAGASGWTPEEWVATQAGGPWPGSHPGTLWETLGAALTRAPLPELPPAVLVALPGPPRRRPRVSRPTPAPPRTDAETQVAWVASLQTTLRGDGTPTGILDDILAEAPRLRMIQHAMGWTGPWGEDPSAVLLAHQTRRGLIPPAPSLPPEATHRLMHTLEAQWVEGASELRPWARQYGDLVLGAVLAPLGESLLAQVAPLAANRLVVERRWVDTGSPEQVEAVVTWLEDYRAARRPGLPASWPATRRVPAWALQPALLQRALVELLPVATLVDRAPPEHAVAVRKAWQDLRLVWQTEGVRYGATPLWRRTLAGLLPVAFLATYLDRPFRVVTEES